MLTIGIMLYIVSIDRIDMKDITFPLRPRCSHFPSQALGITILFCFFIFFDCNTENVELQLNLQSGKAEKFKSMVNPGEHRKTSEASSSPAFNHYNFIKHEEAGADWTVTAFALPEPPKSLHIFNN